MSEEWIDLQTIASDAFRRRLSAVTDWDAPTPDAEWSTRDLVSHVIGEQRAIPATLAGVPLEAHETDFTDTEDAVTAWDDAVNSARTAWRAVAFDAEVNTSGDTIRADDYLREQTSDIAIHTWDLARATGTDEQLPDELVTAVWAQFEPQIESLRASGLYAAPVAVPSDAPLLERLLAATGRDVHRGRNHPVSAMASF